MAAEVDTAYICAAYSIEEPTLQSLIESNAAELVQSLLRQIEKKAHEFDAVKSEKLRAEIEQQTINQIKDDRISSLEQALQDTKAEYEALQKRFADSGKCS
jgi:nucleoprotein TPR